MIFDLICKIKPFGCCWLINRLLSVDKLAETPENTETPENPKIILNHLDNTALPLFPTIMLTTCLSLILCLVIDKQVVHMIRTNLKILKTKKNH